MSTKSINFRVDEELKADAEIILSEMGLSMSSAISLFLQQMVNKRALPFIVEGADPFFSRINQELLEKRLASYENGTKLVREPLGID